MNAVEAGIVMRQLGAGLGGVEIDPEAVEVWARLMPGVDADVAVEAMDLYLQSPEPSHRFFPSVSIFQGFIAQALRERAVAAQKALLDQGPLPSASCGFCAGKGWAEVAPIQKVDKQTGVIRSWEAWRPCASCNPVGFSTWAQYRDGVKREANRRAEEDREFTMAEALDEARAALR